MVPRHLDVVWSNIKGNLRIIPRIDRYRCVRRASVLGHGVNARILVIVVEHVRGEVGHSNIEEVGHSNIEESED